MIDFPETFTNLLKEGENLPGSSEVAMTKEATLKALESLVGSQIAVLGGDVLVQNGNEFSYVYDNWSVEKKSGEAMKDYLSRCVCESKSFVEESSKRHKEPWYVLVVSELGVV